MTLKKFLFFFIGCAVISPALALKFPLPPKGMDHFGEVQFTQTQAGDTFEKIARHYDIGFYELVEANPHINPDKPAIGTEIIIPTQYILPRLPHQGIVINLAAMRLYYFPKGKSYFYTYPVGIGKQGWSTPLGPSRITQKIKHPVWYVPDSIYAYRKSLGKPVPHVVPAGPDNPLGDYGMRLAQPTYLIHGTNEPESVGRRSSAGCIHLYPEDIKALFENVSVNTKVLIVNEPYLSGVDEQHVYIEAHQPLQEQRAQLADVPAVVKQLIEALNLSQKATVDWDKAKAVVKEHTGLTTAVGFIEG